MSESAGDKMVTMYTAPDGKIEFLYSREYVNELRERITQLEQRPPRWRQSERFRWAWMHGEWKSLCSCPHGFWMEHGITSQIHTNTLESNPDFRWGPWALEPDDDPE